MAAQTAKSMTDRGMDNLREPANDLKSGLQEAGASARHAVQEQFEGVRDRVSSYYEQGRERAVELEHSLERQIRERPISALLVATGVGFLIGMLWMRK